MCITFVEVFSQAMKREDTIMCWNVQYSCETETYCSICYKTVNTVIRRGGKCDDTDFFALNRICILTIGCFAFASIFSLFQKRAKGPFTLLVYVQACIVADDLALKSQINVGCIFQANRFEY